MSTPYSNPTETQTNEETSIPNHTTTMAEGMSWYVLRAISGKEGKVKEYIDAEIKNGRFDGAVAQCLIPTEKVIQVRNGKRVVKERNYLPGYVLVEADVKFKDTAYVLRNTPNVLGFLPDMNNPTPLRPSEVSRILSVSENDIADVVSDWTKIPVQKLTEDESRRLVKLEKTLHRRIIGQDEAVEAVAKAIRRGRAGLKDPRRPIGSFLFLGPTGVGKTELSKALAEIVFGSESSMIRVDMSEYMEKFDVSKLVGSPPGYVGYEEGGQLSEQVRRHPYSVVLFDEIEKAHPDIFNILLQVLDEGHITDSQGRKVDFKNTILIMTSNAGAQSIAAPKNLGFGAGNDAKANYETMKGSVMEEVRRIFRPEFLNRIDDTIVFHSLNREELRQIVSLLLKELASRAEAQMQIRLKFRSSVRDQIAEKGFDVKYGARPLRRAVQNEIEDELAEEILSGKIKAGQHVVCTVRGGKIVFVPGKEEEKAQQESAEIEE